MPTPSQTATVSQCFSHVNYDYPSNEVHQTELSFPANTLTFYRQNNSRGWGWESVPDFLIYQNRRPLNLSPLSMLLETCNKKELCRRGRNNPKHAFISRRVQNTCSVLKHLSMKHGLQFLERQDDHMQTFATARSFRPSWPNFDQALVKIPASWFLFMVSMKSYQFHSISERVTGTTDICFQDNRLSDDCVFWLWS